VNPAALLRQARRRHWCPHAPTAKQSVFLELDCLEAMYGGAAGGGKSDALLMAALRYVDVPGYAAILFRLTHTDLALEGAIMDRSHKWLNNTDAHWDGLNKRWRFPSAATLTFGYLDGPRDHERYQSAEFQFVGFDELTQFVEKQYRYLFSRLRRLKGSDVPIRMRGATNPGGVGHEWVQARFGIPDDFDSTDPHTGPMGRVFVPATLEDNPHLDKDEYEVALAQLDEVTRMQLRYGRWARDASGLVYKINKKKNVIAALPELPRGELWSYVLAHDYGFIDALSFALLAYSNHVHEVYVVAADEWTGLTPSEGAEKTQDLVTQYSPDRIVGDLGGLGKGYAEEARRRFYLPIEPARKTDKLGYIKLLNGDLQNAKLLFVAGQTQSAVEQMAALPWADDKQQKEHPAMPNHMADAVLYGWRECRHYWATNRAVVPKEGTKEFAEYQREKRFEAKMRKVERMNNLDYLEEYADS
jgi:hypothetical protein